MFHPHFFLAVDSPSLERAAQTSQNDRAVSLLLPLFEAFPTPIQHAADRNRATRVTAPRSVRVSLTDRCDLACVYCRPSRKDGYLDDRLSFSDFRALIDALLASGIERVRFTGGEPLLSPHVVELVRHARRAGATDVALTTNGTRLGRLARPLRGAGLQRLTLSLDSLRPASFERITRGGDLARVLTGFETALEVGFDEVKLNCVVLRGENDDELESITRWAWERGVVPRFIEVMPIGEGARVAHQLVSAAEILKRLGHLLEPDAPVVDPERGPARYVRSLADSGRRFGVISGTTDTFCDNCDRLRVSSTGVVRPCLAKDDGVEAASILEGGDREALARAIVDAWRLKPDGGTWKGCTEETARTLSMRAIGG